MCSLNGNFYVKVQIYLILSLIVLMLFKRDLLKEGGGGGIIYVYETTPKNR